MDCAPKLRQSEFGHSSANGEEDVRRTETKMGPLAGRIPATGVRTDEELPECEGSGEGTRGSTATVVFVEATGGGAKEGERIWRERGSARPTDTGAGAGGWGIAGVPRSEDAGTGFFRRCLAKDRGVTPEERQAWRDSIYTEIRGWMQSQGGLSIQRMCELATVSRASFYRHWEQKAPTEAG